MKTKKYYLVAEDALPDSLRKTALVKELLSHDADLTVPEASERIGMARSTFYKYRDGISTFTDLGVMQIANMLLTLTHVPGVLGGVLHAIAQFGGNVLTINQILPMQGAALVTVSVALEHAMGSADDLMERLHRQDGVIQVQILGIN